MKLLAMISVFNKHQALKLLPVVILGFLIYSNTMEVPFYLDDLPNIVQNPHIRLTNFSLRDIAGVALGVKGYSKRPVAHISFALNYYFHQNSVIGYHVINIIIHILTSILLYYFTRATLCISMRQSPNASIPQLCNPSIISLFAALIWLVHPIHTQSVTYVVQRMNSMAAMFYVLSLLFYTKGRLSGENQKSWPWFVGCAFAGLLAVGSKETAATLPFFILVYEWYFFQDFSTAWLKRYFPYMIGVLILFGFLVWLYLGSNPLDRILSGYRTWDFTLTERVLTQFRVVIYYIGLLIYPHPSRLCLDHDFSLSHSLFDPITTLVSVGVVVGLIGVAFYIARRESLISFAIIWFFGNLVIESSIIPLDLIFEHRTYLPSMFFFLIIVVLTFRYVRRDWAKVGLLSTAIVLFCLWTYERNSVWKDPMTFWRDSAGKSETKERSRINLGLALAREGKLDEAIAHYSEVLRINPDYAPAHNNLGNALSEQGKLDEAVAHYFEALRIRAQYPEALINLGNALSRQGKLDEAIAHYSKALQYEEAHYNLGLALARQGKLDEAIAHYSKALQINPDYAKAHYSLGLALAGQGKLNRAIARFSEALAIRPDYAEAHYNLGVALAQEGKLDEAISQYSEALRIRPDYAEAHNNLGIILARKGQLDKAIAHFSEALRISPDFVGAHNNLRRALQKVGKSGNM